jgi:hypothetical protein
LPVPSPPLLSFPLLLCQRRPSVIRKERLLYSKHTGHAAWAQIPSEQDPAHCRYGASPLSVYGARSHRHVDGWRQA